LPPEITVLALLPEKERKKEQGRAARLATATFISGSSGGKKKRGKGEGKGGEEKGGSQAGLPGRARDLAQHKVLPALLPRVAGGKERKERKG